jgi:asparagine synthase (glutamine-hydrolysing)
MGVIFGIRNRDGRLIEELDVTQLARSTERYAPDGTSVRVEGELAMGIQTFHTHGRSRLESQPCPGNHGSVLAFDGRLDNYHDLCGLLGLRAHDTPDSFIAFKAFEQWGENCFSQFIGDWSLALWIPKTKLLYLARDHAGTRTLYFEETGERLLWSTHLETFFANGRARELDPEFAASYLTCQPVRERTPYKGVKAVPPAHFLRFGADRMVAVTFWQPVFRHKVLYRTDADYERHFFFLFKQAVARRAAPFDPVIAQLSGGMDSSAIVSMSDFSRRGAGAGPEELIDTISYYDDSEPNWNEKPYFTAVERNRRRAGVHIATAYLHRSVDCPDPGYPLPGADGTALATEIELETRIGRGKYRAILSGVGGDELLGGPINPLPELGDLVARGHVARFLRRGVAWCVSEKTPMMLLLPTVITSTAHLYWPPRQTNANLPPWLTRSARNAVPRSKPLDGISFRHLPSSVDAAYTWFSILESLPHRFPAAHMRYEYRYPFLDRDLVDFLLSVPPEQIRRPGARRSLMRRALRHLIVREVLERKRKAFPARGPALFLDCHRAEIDLLFRESRLSALGYIDETRLRHIFHQHGGVPPDWITPLMRAIDFELWLGTGHVSMKSQMPEPSKIRSGKAIHGVGLERKLTHHEVNHEVRSSCNH